MGEGQEDVIREGRAHDLLVVPLWFADVEICQSGLFGKLGAQVGDNVVIRGAHLRRVEMIERDHGWWSGQRRRSHRNRRDPGKWIQLGALGVCAEAVRTARLANSKGRNMGELFGIDSVTLP